MFLRFPLYRASQLQWHKPFLRELFLLPGYNYNYKNYFPLRREVYVIISWTMVSSLLERIWSHDTPQHHLTFNKHWWLTSSSFLPAAGARGRCEIRGWGLQWRCCRLWPGCLSTTWERHNDHWVNGIRSRPRGDYIHLLGQKSCRTKISRIFWIFVPNFAPNFHRIFRGLFVPRFVGDGDQQKFTKNPRHFSMQNSQANTKKYSQNSSGEQAK